jgi:phosphoribosylaminoimidazole (AIR) synthetase
MGIGLVLAVDESRADEVFGALRATGEPDAVVIGTVVPGTRAVRYA